MFAIIADGGRQYRVSAGDRLSVDLREAASEGDAITFETVLLANGGGASLIGQPAISGATVTGKVIYAVDKGPKLEVQKLRRRKNSRRHTGHRQKYTTVVIEDINVPGLDIRETAEEKPAEQAEA
jgi:large subunit ribosomal protein L21